MIFQISLTPFFDHDPHCLKIPIQNHYGCDATILHINNIKYWTNIIPPKYFYHSQFTKQPKLFWKHTPLQLSNILRSPIHWYENSSFKYAAQVNCQRPVLFLEFLHLPSQIFMELCIISINCLWWAILENCTRCLWTSLIKIGTSGSSFSFLGKKQHGKISSISENVASIQQHLPMTQMEGKPFQFHFNTIY